MSHPNNRPNRHPIRDLNEEARVALAPVAPDAAASANAAGLRAWLEDRVASEPAADWYLLGHGDDGVIWGAWDPARKKLRLSGDAFPEASPALRPETLRMLRLFGTPGELLLWREDEGTLRGRWARDTTADAAASPDFAGAFDERLLLWGNTGGPECSGFRLWTDGAQGLAHAIPLPAGGAAAPPRLVVRHYLHARETAARVALSRLVSLESDSRTPEKETPKQP